MEHISTILDRVVADIRSKPQEATFVLTLPKSCNHAYKNITKRLPSGKSYTSKMLTDKSQSWQDVSRLVATCESRKQGWKIPNTDTKVVVELWAYWPDAVKRDMNNLHKLTADALEGAIYANDRYALIRDIDFSIDRKNPRLEVRVSLKEDEK